MKAEPTIPKTVFTPSATRVSTSASLGVIFCLGMIFTSKIMCTHFSPIFVKNSPNPSSFNP